MSYMQEYEKWLASPALSEQEHAELESIREHPRHPLGHSGLCQRHLR